jgi:hypothetical protein
MLCKTRIHLLLIQGLVGINKYQGVRIWLKTRIKQMIFVQ